MELLHIIHMHHPDTHHTMPEPERDAYAHLLEKINQNITELREDVRGLNTVLPDAKSTNTEAQSAHKESGKATSRTVLALIFAGLGFKLGALAGVKLGFLRAALRKPEEVEKAAESLEKMAEKTSIMQSIPEGYAHYVKDSAIYGGVGSIIGAASGGLLGWTRGNRIENPGDLLSKPIESIGKILGSAPEKAEATPSPEVALSEEPKPHTQLASPAKQMV